MMVGMVLLLILWYGPAGALSVRRRLVQAVRDGAFLAWATCHLGLGMGSCACIRYQCCYTTGLLVKWVTFLSTLHWPVGGADLGFGGVSFVELLTLYELWAGERLTLEKSHPRYLRPGRPISVSAVPFGPGIDIWLSHAVLLEL